MPLHDAVLFLFCLEALGVYKVQGEKAMTSQRQSYQALP